MKVLVTGGAGYIGSVTATALEAAGHVPIVLDSLDVGPRAFVGDRMFYQGDIGDSRLIARIVAEHPDLECTIHLAARTVVPDSVRDPLAYYRCNVVGTLQLAESLVRLGRPRLVFSSSAAIYGETRDFAVDESAPLDPASPYARTKLIGETILADVASATDLRVLALRYFNPVGSDPDLRSGIHAPVPTHVVGQLVRAARGQGDGFAITGTDLPTRDGTGLRDYVHVWDIALAHVRAVERLDEALRTAGAAFLPVNLGTGKGTTVRELVVAFERAWGSRIAVRETGPRPGDAIGGYAVVDRAEELLGWTARHSLEDAIRSALDWDDRRAEVLGYS